MLSILSKVCEKNVAASFMDYLVKTGLLYELQSAFRAGHSTESAMISLFDSIIIIIIIIIMKTRQKLLHWWAWVLHYVCKLASCFH